MEYSSRSLATHLKATDVQRALGYLDQIAGSLDGEEQVQAGALNGVTIMRYAHLFRARASGGVEQYLRQLDQGCQLGMRFLGDFTRIGRLRHKWVVALVYY